MSAKTVDRYLILGRPLLNALPDYRGTFRERPSYVTAKPEGDEVNVAFLEYCSEGGELGALSDLRRAQALVELYDQLEPRQTFEVVRILGATEAPRTSEEVLGYDLSMAYHHSLLATGLKFTRVSSATAPDAQFSVALARLRVVADQFKPHLNSNILFPTLEQADSCLRGLVGAQGSYPGLLENDQYLQEFQPVGLVATLRT